MSESNKDADERRRNENSPGLFWVCTNSPQILQLPRGGVKVGLMLLTALTGFYGISTAMRGFAQGAVKGSGFVTVAYYMINYGTPLAFVQLLGFLGARGMIKPGEDERLEVAEWLRLHFNLLFLTIAGYVAGGYFLFKRQAADIQWIRATAEVYGLYTTADVETAVFMYTKSVRNFLVEWACLSFLLLFVLYLSFDFRFKLIAEADKDAAAAAERKRRLALREEEKQSLLSSSPRGGDLDASGDSGDFDAIEKGSARTGTARSNRESDERTPDF